MILLIPSGCLRPLVHQLGDIDLSAPDIDLSPYIFGPTQPGLQSGKALETVPDTEYVLAVIYVKDINLPMFSSRSLNMLKKK